MAPIWAYVGGGALLAGVLGGWTLRDWKADSDELAALERADEARKETEQRWFDQSKFYQDQIYNLSDRSNTNRETIRTIYRDVKVPAQCAVPDNVAGVLNDAVRAANAAAAGGPVTTVPSVGDAPETAD